MDKWTTLEPVKLYTQAGASWLGRGVQRQSTVPRSSFIGRLPVEVHLLVLQNLPIFEIPSYARVSRALGALTNDERIWERRWRALGLEKRGLEPILDRVEDHNKTQAAPAKGPPTLSVLEEDDDFGDFATGVQDTGDLADFTMPAGSSSNANNIVLFAVPGAGVYRNKYTRAHALLKSLTRHLLSPPHLVLSSLFPGSQPLRQQSRTLQMLQLFLSSRIQPLRSWHSLLLSLRATIDRFQAHLLTAFDIADQNKDEKGMNEAAHASWDVWDGSGSDEWEIGRMWAEKREVFYEQGKWESLQNFT